MRVAAAEEITVTMADVRELGFRASEILNGMKDIPRSEHARIQRECLGLYRQICFDLGKPDCPHALDEVDENTEIKGSKAKYLYIQLSSNLVAPAQVAS